MTEYAAGDPKGRNSKPSKNDSEVKTIKVTSEYFTRSGNVYVQELLMNAPMDKIISEQWYRKSTTGDVNFKGLLKNAVYVSWKRYQELKSQEGDKSALINTAKKDKYYGKHGIIWFLGMDNKTYHSSPVINPLEDNKESGLVKKVNSAISDTTPAIAPKSSEIVSKTSVPVQKETNYQSDSQQLAHPEELKLSSDDSGALETKKRNVPDFSNLTADVENELGPDDIRVID